jgi:hypothetical protein
MARGEAAAEGGAACVTPLFRMALGELDPENEAGG